jgi:hypothetical protein
MAASSSAPPPYSASIPGLHPDDPDLSTFIPSGEKVAPLRRKRRLMGSCP